MLRSGIRYILEAVRTHRVRSSIALRRCARQPRTHRRYLAKRPPRQSSTLAAEAVQTVAVDGADQIKPTAGGWELSAVRRLTSRSEVCSGISASTDRASYVINTASSNSKQIE